MNRIIFLIVLFFAMIYDIYGQELKYCDKLFENDTTINCAPLNEQEILEYNIKVGLLSVGRINFIKSNCKNSKLINAEIVGYTKGLTNLFFDLNVNYESYFLDKEYTPHKFIKLIYESGNTKQEEICFDDKLKKAHYKNKNNIEEQFFLYENRLFDLVSGIYFFRSKIKVINKENSSFQIQYIHNGDGIKNLKIDFLGIDEIKVSGSVLQAKKFLCVFESKNKLLKNKTEVYFWVSSDKYKLPIFIEARTRFSKVKIELKNISDYIDIS